MKQHQEMKTLMITGGSSGIGKVTAELFADNGYKVFELSRHGASSNRIIHISCDVTNPEQCKEAVENVIRECGKIDILINNAGMGVSGAVEFTDINEAKRQFDVNFFGAVNVTNAVIPYMRKAEKSRIIFVSSLAALFPIPFQGFYSASKCAIDGLACSLRNELRPFGIDVCCLLPGDVKTGFTASRAKCELGNDVYKNMHRAVNRMEYDEQHGISAERMAKKLLRLAKAKRTCLYSTVGLQYQTIMLLNNVLPATFVNRVVGMIYG